ncbi:hypothetical protein BSKO_05215 [Bryopsis sp. KO-2023]|nr:hypothetical protein BSKO_05215 [Bryopsis sp. KO-2023]
MADLQQQLKELSAADVTQYSGFISQLGSVDGAKRGEAEKLLDAFGRHHPDAFVGKFLEVLAKGPQAENRTVAATILRKVVPTGNPPMWANLDESCQAALKSQLLVALKEEPERSVRTTIGTFVSELVSKVLGVDDWPEVLPFVTQSIQSGEEKLTETSLLILSEIAPVIMEAVKSELENFGRLFLGCLGSASAPVRLAGLKASKAFIVLMDDEADLAKFKSLVPMIIGALNNIPKQAGEKGAVQAYSTVIELVEEYPGFFQDHLPNIVAEMLQHSRSSSMPMGVRNMAVELLIVVIETSTHLEEKIPQVVESLVPELIKVLMDFMLDIENEEDWYVGNNGNYDDEESFSEFFTIGQTGVDRVAHAMGGAVLFPILVQLLPAWAMDLNWKKRHAGIILIGQIAEGCKEALDAEFTSMLSFCLRGLNDVNPRVRWASCQSIGLLTQEIETVEEDSEVEGELFKVVEALVHLAKDKTHDRVRQHTFNALINICSQAELELYGAGLDAVVSTILEAVQDGSMGTQDVALSCLTEVSVSCPPGSFQLYYEATMKVLHGMMSTRVRMPNSTLPVAKILDTMGKIGVASGRTIFSEDCKQVVAYIEEVLKIALKMPEEDEEKKQVLSFLFGAAEAVCRGLRELFKDHVGQFIPPLVAVLQSQLQVEICDAADWDESMEMSCETIEIAGKILSVDVDALKQKGDALRTVQCFGEYLEGHLPLQHISTLVESAAHLLGSPLTKEVRELAISVQPVLLKCAYEASRMNPEGAQSDFLNTLLKIEWNLLLEQLTQFDHAVCVSTIPVVIGALAQSLFTVGDLLSDEMVNQACTKVNAALEHFLARRKDREEMAAEGELTPEEEEDMEEELQLEQDLYDKLEDFLSTFLKSYGEKCMPFIDAVVPKLAPMMHSSTSPGVAQMVVIMMTDIVEYVPPGAAKFLDVIMTGFLEGSKSGHSGLRHCSCFGVGVVAQKVSQGFKPYAQQAVAHLMNAMNSDDAREEDFLSATDNAVSALGKVFEAHGDLMDVKALVSKWLQFLPLQNDKVEAMAAHEQLIRLVEKMDVEILGEGNQNATHLAKVMMAVLAKGDKLISKEAGSKMVNLLRHLEGVVPKEIMADALQKMPDDEKENLQAFSMGRM